MKYILIILIGIIGLSIGLSMLLGVLIKIFDQPEIPTIDGVPMRNEAQMYGGYREL
jgi:hypothetical protein